MTMIIDGHVHVWPDALAARALGGDEVPGLERFGDGTVAGAVLTPVRVPIFAFDQPEEGFHA